MNTLLIGLAGEALKEVVLPVLGAVLLGYGTLLAAKIREKTGVDVTEKLNSLLNRALERMAAALVAKVASGELPHTADIVAMGVEQIRHTMPETLEKLKTSSFDLVAIVSNAVARETAKAEQQKAEQQKVQPAPLGRGVF